MEYRFELTGRMPLLFHADIVEMADELEAWRKDPKNKSLSVPGDDRSPPWTWTAYLYHDGENLALPAENIMVALRHAGGKLTLKGQTTFKSLSQSSLLILSEFCPFLCDGKPVPILPIGEIRDEPFSAQSRWAKDNGFSLFVKRAKVGQNKHVRVRARFDHWSVSGTIETLDPAITGDVLSSMFELAGRYSGLCDWRPSSPKSPGNFGTFSSVVKPVVSQKRKAG